jgi:hypothetical protein
VLRIQKQKIMDRFVKLDRPTIMNQGKS